MTDFLAWIFMNGNSISTLVSTIVLLLGLVGLYFGADFLIRGGANVALSMGIRKVVIGLTVVAFGTSLPEMVVSVTSTLAGKFDFAIGNVVGSNIANIALVLGVAAIIRPVDVEKVLIKLDMWILLGVSFLFMFLASDGVINFFDGIILIFAFVGYMFWIFYTAKEHHIESEIDNGEKKKNVLLNLILLILGLGILVLGAQFTVKGGTAIAIDLGIPDLIIALTIFAIGTSLPELATAIVAQIRKEADITVGNIVGSNIFNILFVIGVSAIVAPIVVSNPVKEGLEVIPAALHIYMPIMLAIAIILLPLLATHNKVSRKEGIFLLLCYIAYISYIVIAGNMEF